MRQHYTTLYTTKSTVMSVTQKKIIEIDFFYENLPSCNRPPSCWRRRGGNKTHQESHGRRQLVSAERAEGKEKEPKAGPHKLARQPLGVWTHLEEHYTAGASVLIINAKSAPRAPRCGKPLWTHSSGEMIRCREILQIPSDLHPLHFL